MISLYYRGKLLIKDDETVADLRIRRKDIIYVKQVADDTISLDSDSDDGKSGRKREGKRKREEGEAFKGTLLGGGGLRSSPLHESSPSPVPPEKAQKACATCTLLNPAEATECDACGLLF